MMRSCVSTVLSANVFLVIVAEIVVQIYFAMIDVLHYIAAKKNAKGKYFIYFVLCFLRNVIL